MKKHLIACSLLALFAASHAQAAAKITHGHRGQNRRHPLA